MKLKRYPDIPEPELIGPDLYCISLPQPFYAPNNIYVLNGPEPALIDSGYVQNLGLLQKSLQSIGLSLRKIKHVFYTHDHVDHISAALVIRYYSPARLYGMSGMAEAVGDYRNHIKLMQRAMNRLIYKSHSNTAARAPELEKSESGWSRFFDSFSHGKVDPLIRIDEELVEGDVIRLGNREIGFLHTPGHNRWHLTPYILGESIYFTGDLVLENISSVYAEIDGNLNQYYDSLARLSRLPVKRLLPAHGREPHDPARSIRLLSKTLGLLERGVMRRLKEGQFDLKELAISAMGEKIKDSSHYITAIAIIHAIIQKFQANGQVQLHEVDPPYEQYSWKNSN